MPFSAEWLALREPADELARSASLTEEVSGVLGGGITHHALDLATGTGANVRYLIDGLPAVRRWLLVDSDPALLEQIPARMSAWAHERRYHTFGDATELSLQRRQERRVLATRLLDLRAIDDATIFSECTLVTASALLDLVSESWVSALIARCRQSRAVVLFALSYDGRIQCEPEEPDDGMLRDLVNRHQRGDKGFGAALGPDAARVTSECLVAAGYRVRREQSDWDLPPAMSALQRQLIDGWAEAAIETAPSSSSRIENWRMRRLSHVDHGQSHLIVGHEDIAGWLVD